MMWPFKNNKSGHIAMDPLDRPVIQVSPSDWLRERDLHAGTLAIGASGSGKTSGFGTYLARATLAHGYGGLVQCVKVGEADRWREHVHVTGRDDSLITLSADNTNVRWNILDDVARRVPAGSVVEALVDLIGSAADAADRTGGSTGAIGGDPFWRHSRDRLIRACVSLLYHSGNTISFQGLMRVIGDAPSHPRMLQDPAFLRSSFTLECFRQADAEATDDMMRADLAADARYLLGEHPTLPARTQSSIIATVTAMCDAFGRGYMRELLCTDSTFKPEMVHQGGILLTDLPPKRLGIGGKLAQVLIRRAMQDSLEARQVHANTRPVALWVDEYAEIAAAHDAVFQATARESRVSSVYLCQNIGGLISAFGGRTPRDTMNAVLGSLANKFILANGDAATNKWAAELIGKHRSTRYSSQQRDSEADPWQQHGSGGSVSASESVDEVLLPTDFQLLRTGGPRNGFLVDAVLFSSHVFNSTGKPWLRLSFDQRL